MGITASCQKRLESDWEGHGVSTAITHLLFLYWDHPSFHLNTGTWLISYILSKSRMWLTRNRTERFKYRSRFAKRKSCPAVHCSFAKHKSNEIPLLRETGCSTKPLATEAVLIFWNNSLRTCILSLSSQKTAKDALELWKSILPKQIPGRENPPRWPGK